MSRRLECSLDEPRTPRDVLAKMLNCDIVVSEFELQSHNYIYFGINTLGKGMNPFIFPAMC